MQDAPTLRMTKRRLRLLTTLLTIAILMLLVVSSALAQTDKPPRTPVSSPLFVSFEIDCKHVASVQVVLDDEYRDILARQILVPDCLNNSTQTIKTKVYFDTFERLTTAHLSISAYDPETRWIWIKSDNIVFTDSKKSMDYSFVSENPLHISQPIDGTALTERVFTVSGNIQVGQPRSAYFELVSEDGRVLGSALLHIPSSVVDGQWDFEFPFEITAARYKGSARLTMQQFGLDIYGIESLTSVLIDIDI